MPHQTQLQQHLVDCRSNAETARKLLKSATRELDRRDDPAYLRDIGFAMSQTRELLRGICWLENHHPERPAKNRHG